MDDTITRGILFGSHPPKGIYFTVVVEYNHDNPIYEGKMNDTIMESSPLRSFTDALEASDIVAEKLIGETFQQATVTEVETDSNQGYHLYIHDVNEDPLARVGVEMHDIRKETLH